MAKYIKKERKHRNCSNCGNKFLPFRESSSCCSKQCAYDYLISIRKKIRAEKSPSNVEKTCNLCGVKYKSPTSLSRFCSDKCSQRAKYLKNRSPEIVTGKKMALRGKPQSPEHIKKRMDSAINALKSNPRNCVKCNEEYIPTSPAQKYCSGRCWQAVNRKPRSNRLYYNKVEYDKFYQLQNGKCAICGVESGSGNRGDKLALDHCHSTQKLRGLLCHRCNTAIGLFKDNTQIIESAIKYLQLN